MFRTRSTYISCQSIEPAPVGKILADETVGVPLITMGAKRALKVVVGDPAKPGGAGIRRGLLGRMWQAEQNHPGNERLAKERPVEGDLNLLSLGHHRGIRDAIVGDEHRAIAPSERDGLAVIISKQHPMTGRRIDLLNAAGALPPARRQSVAGGCR